MPQRTVEVASELGSNVYPFTILLLLGVAVIILIGRLLYDWISHS